MAGPDQRANRPDGLSGTGLRIGIVRSAWNSEIINRLAGGVQRTLTDLGVTDGDVLTEHVPGAFEIPLGAQILARSGKVDAIITLGAVIRGETTHYEIVSEGAATGVARVQLDTGIPVAFGLVTVENHEQALARSQGPDGHNVGSDAAVVAVQMARLAEQYPPAS